jgi:hypothetical protein
MADDIQLKRSDVPGLAPAAGELLEGELAFNTYDGKLYAKDASGNVFVVNPSASLTAIEAGGDNVTIETAAGVATISVNQPTVEWGNISGRPTKVSELTNDSGFVDAIGAADAAPVQGIVGANAAVVSTIGGLYTVDVPGQLRSDWLESDPESVSFIENKPTQLSDFTNDPGYITAQQAADAAPVQSISGVGAVVVTNDSGAFTVSAPAQVQANWSEQDSLNPSFIQNKPLVVSDLDNDAGYVTSADAAAAAPVQDVLAGSNVSITKEGGAYTVSALLNDGITSVSASLPITIGGDLSEPVIGVEAATQQDAGVVRLATESEVADGSSGVVVDAAQLKASIPTKLSELTNDQNLVTQESASSQIASAVASYLPLSGGTVAGALVVAPGGSSQAPTPPAGDSSSSVATTEWVQRELSGGDDVTDRWTHGGADTTADPMQGFIRVSADGSFLAISKYASSGGLASLGALSPGDIVLLATASAALLLETGDNLTNEFGLPITTG